MIEGPRTSYELDEGDDIGRLTDAQAAEFIDAGLVYVSKTTHTLAPLPGKEAAVAAHLYGERKEP